MSEDEMKEGEEAWKKYTDPFGEVLDSIEDKEEYTKKEKTEAKSEQKEEESKHEE